ncbi:hypothetical protein F0562_013454 [Nyssa sinensis]|uniref:Uncharacterized protein n=1 Tax=Nyssa sinensis TaxID=561372 RepID=A0A5J4ZNH2_9ASTE|nr:hypothetical protein F0562_013454 [Nyssa sinensis]
MVQIEVPLDQTEEEYIRKPKEAQRNSEVQGGQARTDGPSTGTDARNIVTQKKEKRRLNERALVCEGKRIWEAGGGGLSSGRCNLGAALYPKGECSRRTAVLRGRDGTMVADSEMELLSRVPETVEMTVAAHGFPGMDSALNGGMDSLGRREP